MTLKEQYWIDGYILRMSTGDYRIVCGDNLIDKYGYIPKSSMSEDLHNLDSKIDEHVVEVYMPNIKARCLSELIEPNTEPIWICNYKLQIAK